MKRLLPLFLVIFLILGGCAPQSENPPVLPPADDTSNQTPVVPDTPQGDNEIPDMPTPDPVVAYRNPLNGAPLETPYLGRPVAVMLNNIKEAMPQFGVSKADILYEVLAEGGVTRCMGIFSDISNVNSVGSIRSARKYYVQLAQAYQAIYLHFGGSEEALNYLKNIGWNDIDGSNGGDCYFFDKNRNNHGYASYHCWFATGSKVLPYAEKLHFKTQYDTEKSYGMTFNDDKIIVGGSGNKVVVNFHLNGPATANAKKTTLTYNTETKTYFAHQSGNSHGNGSNYVDGATGETLDFRNVLVLRAASALQADNYLLTVNTVGSGTGYFLCNGYSVPISWSRASANDPFTYTLENGDPVTFGVGSTYIAVVPTGATVSIT